MCLSNLKVSFEAVVCGDVMLDCVILRLLIIYHEIQLIVN